MEKAKIENAVSAAGPSLLETLWSELDTIVDRLKADGAPEDVPPRPTVQNPRPLAAWRWAWTQYGEERGRAQGLAYAIAVIEAPYDVNVPRVQKLAAKRWKERNKK